MQKISLLLGTVYTLAGHLIKAICVQECLCLPVLTTLKFLNVPRTDCYWRTGWPRKACYIILTLQPQTIFYRLIVPTSLHMCIEARVSCVVAVSSCGALLPHMWLNGLKNMHWLNRENKKSLDPKIWFLERCLGETTKVECHRKICRQKPFSWKKRRFSLPILSSAGL